MLDDALRGARVVVELPAGGVHDWIPAAETLLLEGLRTWVFPVSLLGALPEALALYGRRARIGVGHLVDADGVRRAVAAGAHFLTSPTHRPELRDAAGDVPLVSGALTPSEIADAVAAGADAVQVGPVDVLGTSYARALPLLFPGLPLLVAGRLERYQAEMWLEAGAAAVCIQGVILQPEGAGSGSNEPASLRRRLQGFAPLMATSERLPT